MAEWLRRWTANPLCSARVGSNPIHVEIYFDHYSIQTVGISLQYVFLLYLFWTPSGNDPRILTRPSLLRLVFSEKCRVLNISINLVDPKLELWRVSQLSEPQVWPLLLVLPCWPLTIALHIVSFDEFLSGLM